MPLFYLHIRSDGQLIPDEEGSEYGNLEAAHVEAIRGARSLMSEEVEAGHLRMDQAIEIHDARGRHRLSVRFDQALVIEAASGG